VGTRRRARVSFVSFARRSQSTTAELPPDISARSSGKNSRNSRNSRYVPRTNLPAAILTAASPLPQWRAETSAQPPAVLPPFPRYRYGPPTNDHRSPDTPTRGAHPRCAVGAAESRIGAEASEFLAEQNATVAQ
jgi:hypothetical protein